MSSLEMKEIRLPSALILERRPSVIYTVLKSCATALALGAMSFFVLNVLAITALAIFTAVRHKAVDFSVAYRYFAAPLALTIFMIALIGSLVFFFRERSR
jgi:uncharacterized integral membrane protein